MFNPYINFNNPYNVQPAYYPTKWTFDANNNSLGAGSQHNNVHANSENKGNAQESANSAISFFNIPDVVFLNMLKHKTDLSKENVQNETSSSKSSDDELTYVYDDKGNKVSATKTTAKGTVVEYIYDGDLIVSEKQTKTDGSVFNCKYLDGKRVSGEYLTYTDDGALASQKQYVYDSEGNRVTLSKLTYQYDENGRLQSTRLYYYENEEAILISKDKYNYSKNGNMTTVKTYTYNKDREITSTSVCNTQTYIGPKPTITPTPEGSLISFYPDGELILNQGETIKRDIHQIIVTSADKKTVTIYEQDGTVLSYKVDGKKQNVRNATLPVFAQDKEEKTSKEIIKDEFGNKVKEIIKDMNGNIISEIEHVYANGVRTGKIQRDYKDNVIDKVSTIIFDENGSKKEKIVIDKEGTTNYTYLPDGNQKSKTITNMHGEKIVYEYSYKDTDVGVEKTMVRTDYRADGNKRIEKTQVSVGDDILKNEMNIFHSETDNVIENWVYFYKEGKILKKIVKCYAPDGVTLVNRYVTENHSPNWYGYTPRF